MKNGMLTTGELSTFLGVAISGKDIEDRFGIAPDERERKAMFYTPTKAKLIASRLSTELAEKALLDDGEVEALVDPDAL